MPLDLAISPQTGPLLHITWCPIGPLAQLPLHAAGLYSDPDGPRGFNYVVSSYAPSLLSTLLHCHERTVKSGSSPSILVVSQPATPGFSPLPGTIDEARRLGQIFDVSQMQWDILDDRQATASAVRYAIGQHPWLYLACHGHQDLGDAIRSAFGLYDGPLALSDLMATMFDNAELAFLSTCYTAVRDEKTPEESVILVAGVLAVGFKGVVSTMWSIADADTPIVAEAYYKKLLELRSVGTLGRGETGAAYALHEAVKVLRDHVGEEKILRWAPFVHYGA